jgi:hypothetical protein
MIRAFVRKLQEILSEKIVYWLISVVGLLTTSGVGAGFINDPFYHEGWIASYRGWVLVFVILSVIGIALCTVQIGFWITCGIALLCAVTFASIYEHADFQQNHWPFLAWLLHGIVFSLLIGILARAIDMIALKLFRVGRSSHKKRSARRKSKPSSQ